MDAAKRSSPLCFLAFEIEICWYDLPTPCKPTSSLELDTCMYYMLGDAPPLCNLALRLIHVGCGKKTNKKCDMFVHGGTISLSLRVGLPFCAFAEYVSSLI